MAWAFKMAFLVFWNLFHLRSENEHKKEKKKKRKKLKTIIFFRVALNEIEYFIFSKFYYVATQTLNIYDYDISIFCHN
jgi:hypothetical protein